MKKNKKFLTKILNFLLFISLLVALTGCSSETYNDQVTEDLQTNVTDTKKNTQELTTESSSKKTAGDTKSLDIGLPTITIVDDVYSQTFDEVKVINVKKPVISIDGSDNLSKSINTYIEKYIEEELKGFDEALNYFNLDFKESKKLGIKYGIDISYDIKHSSYGLLSIKFMSSQMTGQAYPSNTIRTMNFFIGRENELSFSELFKEEYDFKPTVESLIKSLISNQTSDGNAVYYESFNGELNGDESFYIDQSGINIVYSHGKVAPHALGEIIFTIPFDSIKAGLNNKYFSDIINQ